MPKQTATGNQIRLANDLIVEVDSLRSGHDMKVSRSEFASHLIRLGIPQYKRVRGINVGDTGESSFKR